MDSFMVSDGKLQLVDSSGNSKATLLELELSGNMGNYSKFLTSMNIGDNPIDVEVQGKTRAKDIFVNANGRVKITYNGGETIIGTNIYVPDVFANGITIEAVDKTMDYGIIKSVAEGDNGQTIITLDEAKQYNYSKLVGTPVAGPFKLESETFGLAVGNSQILYGTLENVADGDDPETGTLVAASMTAAFEEIAGYTWVTVTYDTETNKFTIKCVEEGSFDMDFSGYRSSLNPVVVGMANPTLYQATLTGVDGDDFIVPGSTPIISAEIDSADGNIIVLADSSYADFQNEAGHMFRIARTTQLEDTIDATVLITV